MLADGAPYAMIDTTAPCYRDDINRWRRRLLTKAAVFAVDEKTAVQALDRLGPILPLSPARSERHGFDYYRHGTLSPLAALDTKSGEVRGPDAAAPYERRLCRISGRPGGQPAEATRYSRDR
jgi:hypothetical protein